MARRPSVTVLTPTYNRPAYLAETVRSVLEQRFADWEMLVINDGGVDVGHIVRKFGDERLRYFPRAENRGKAACLNFGLERARGDYVAYLDDDDVWYPDHLHALVEALDRNGDAGVAYSDLYRVIFLRDGQGRRYPLQKNVEVCRDYNRMFMFHFNHTLHVSLMHRKGLALRAGGYDESVRVLIDWNLTRKLSFYTDFIHVPAVTGEYYVPLTGSDRISDVQRRDEVEYRQNLRRIRADLPPEPWPMVEKVAVVFPVQEWSECELDVVRYLAERLDYPCRIVLVNGREDYGEGDCARALGPLAELKHLRVVPAPPGAGPGAYYTVGMDSIEADHYYLPSPWASVDVDCRLISGLSYLAETGCDGVRWPEDPVRDGPCDLMVRRQYRTSPSDPGQADVRTVPRDWFPEAFKMDYLLHFAERCCEEGAHAVAQQLLDEVQAIPSGASGQAYLVQLYARVAFGMGNYERAERMCKDLISRGYGCDNWVTLGRILQERTDYAAAADAYRQALQGIGLGEEDVDAGPFPIMCAGEFDAFRAMVGLGECLLEMGRDAEAAPALRRASRLCANNHRAYLAFARIFLRQGSLDRAAEALELARQTDPEERVPALHAAFGQLMEARGRIAEAYGHWLRAQSAAPDCEEYALRAAGLAESLGRREDAERIHKELLSHRPGNVRALLGLAKLCLEAGRAAEAAELARRAMLLSPDHAGARSLLEAALAGPAGRGESSPPAVRLGS